ncbi:MAG TPA: IS21 family transposase [Jiangellaceae bacterium]
MKNAKERMDVIAAYRDVGTYRGAAAMCGTTHKTVKRIIEAHEAASRGDAPAPRAQRGKNYESVTELVAAKVKATSGRISAKRLLPAARAAGYEGSDRNFRRLVADAKQQWRAGHARTGGRRPAVWSPGEVLAIDWGTEKIAGRTVHVFCGVLAWSRFRFVRFAADEKQATTLGLLAEFFEVLGGVPKVVLADRMACLKGGVVANVVVPSPDYVRFAAHYRFRPDFCHAADPESKGIVEHLVGYAKDDLLVPFELDHDPWGDGLAGLNTRAVAWCEQVNGRRHSEIAAIPAYRLRGDDGTGGGEAELLGDLPSLQLDVGPKPITRKVDKLSCIRFGSGRYSVPNRLIGTTVTVLVDDRDRVLRVVEPVTGQVHAEHALVAPGEVSIDDAHYDRPRPATPRRAARPRTAAEREFLALGPVAEQFLVGAAAAGVTKLGTEVDDLLTLAAAHGTDALVTALERAVAFGRWRADDVRSILATNGHAPHPRAAGQALVMTLPTVPTRSLDAYRISGHTSEPIDEGGEVS